jgi:glycine/D-amino acid oxidase-like deaminating enzyme
MVPALGAYLECGMHKPFVDGGYYCKTRENRLLVGPTPVAGFHVLCGLSGYGIMASLGAAELLGAHVAGAPLPPYARELSLARYQDPEYLARLPDMSGGQL